MSSNTKKRYVSKSPHFTVHVRGAIVDYITDDYGRVREREVDPPLVAEFQNLRLKSDDKNERYDRAFATRKFFPNAAWRDAGLAPGHQILGAVPSMVPQGMYEPGPNGSQKLVGMTSAYDPTQHFGVFYLDWEPNEKRRKEIETALDAHGLNGIEYAEITPEALTAPWPTYDKIGQGAVAKIPALVKDLGVDAYSVLEYEQATKNRDGVVAALRSLIDEQTAEAADEAGLERVL